MARYSIPTYHVRTYSCRRAVITRGGNALLKLSGEKRGKRFQALLDATRDRLWTDQLEYAFHFVDCIDLFDCWTKKKCNIKRDRIILTMILQKITKREFFDFGSYASSSSSSSSLSSSITIGM